MIKAIITDLDRTLLRTDKTISEYTLKVLNKCKEKDILVCIATARPLRNVTCYLEKFPFDAYAVMNGAKIVCGKYEDTVPMNEALTENLLKVLSDNDLTISLEMGGEVYVNKYITDYDFVLYNDFPKLPKGEAPYKILVTLEDESTLEFVKNNIPKEFYFSVANDHLIQIADKRANKLCAVKRMFNCLGIKKDEAIYFGDDNDDIEPLKYCAIGAAVGNSLEIVKAAADIIIEDNNSDGVAKYIEKFILGEN